MPKYNIENGIAGRAISETKNKISIKRLADKDLRAIYSKKIIVKKNQKTPCILDKNTP